MLPTKAVSSSAADPPLGGKLLMLGYSYAAVMAWEGSCELEDVVMRRRCGRDLVVMIWGRRRAQRRRDKFPRRGCRWIPSIEHTLRRTRNNGMNSASLHRPVVPNHTLPYINCNELEHPVLRQDRHYRLLVCFRVSID